MNDVEDMLREGMERFTADLRAPAGLTHQVVLRRRRRLALRSAAGLASALTAAAVGLVAASLPGAGLGTTPAVYTAYVVKHLDSALSTAEPGEIAQMMVTTRRVLMPGGKTVTTTGEEWSYGDQWRAVTYSTAGHLVYDEGFSSSSVYTLVSYLTRTWATQPGLGRPADGLVPQRGASVLGPRKPRVPGPSNFPVLGPHALAGPTAPLVAVPRDCEPVVAGVQNLFQLGLPGVGFSASSLPGIGFSASSLPMARALRSAISCGILVIAGRPRVDGVETIKLTSRPSSPISETIWVRPGTYLPVRVIVRSALGLASQQTANITWLRPTAQNLAKLAVPVPAGFRRVALPLALVPIVRQFPAGLLKPSLLCFGRPGKRVPKQCFQLRRLPLGPGAG